MTEPESTWSQCLYKYPDSLFLLLVKLDEQTETKTKWKLFRKKACLKLWGDYLVKLGVSYPFAIIFHWMVAFPTFDHFTSLCLPSLQTAATNTKHTQPVKFNSKRKSGNYGNQQQNTCCVTSVRREEGRRIPDNRGNICTPSKLN